MSSSKQLNGSEAVKAAKDYLLDFYENLEPETVQLEEVEQTEEAWVVTLSFKHIKETGESERMSKILTAPKRQYKVFTLHKNGELKSMKRKEYS